MKDTEWQTPKDVLTDLDQAQQRFSAIINDSAVQKVDAAYPELALLLRAKATRGALTLVIDYVQSILGQTDYHSASNDMHKIAQFVSRQGGLVSEMLVVDDARALTDSGQEEAAETHIRLQTQQAVFQDLYDKLKNRRKIQE